MNARLQTRVGRAVEVAGVLGTFILFLAVGMYSGQTTMSVDIISPPDGMQFQSSPVELVAKVTVRGAPIPQVGMRFTIHNSTTGEEKLQFLHTDADGVAKLVLPAKSGDYNWTVVATERGYPSVTSTPRRFSVRLSLVVDALSPSIHPFMLAVSPVDFMARVTDMKGRPVESAEVTFYVDSVLVGSNVTEPSVPLVSTL